MTWTCVIDLPPDPVTKKRRQKRLSAPTRKALENLQATTLHQLHIGTYIEPSTATTGEYLNQWLAAAEPTLRPSSYLRYKGALDKQIISALGSIPLRKLGGAYLQRFYADRLAAGLSPTTIGLYHGSILHNAFEQAVKWQLMPRNPCDTVTPPRPAKTEMQTWTAEQARTFLTGTAADPLAALFRLALNTGMRQGELLGLRWDDLDPERGVLAVRRTVSRAKDGAVAYGEPKRAAARLGLPVIRFHDQRHTAATIALADGQHPKIVQERLGHSDISQTLNRYSHVSMSMQHEAAARLERLLGS